MPAQIQLNVNDRIVFIGDSITDAERHRRAYEPLGFGYVHFVGYALLAKYPHLDLDIVNRGVSGDTVADMAARWPRDCLALRPNLLSVLIGINDIWRSVMEPNRKASTPQAYGVTYDRLLSQARQQCDCRIVLAEPFLFDNDPHNPVRQALESYRAVVRTLAEKHDAVPVALQQHLDERIVHVPPARWSQDTVHPYLWAHAWIAQQWLAATAL
ncbi:MAG: SGNH/GDSL hydrolase family protein [Sedimentisphaerales bacterium]|nr:SGNH/GDSL hydrolase family protein [Sedimentisphaerales bacterium]